MHPEGKFKKLVKTNNKNLSLAIDCIPLEMGVTKEDYENFLNYYKLSINTNENRLSAATRLLCMKRPDYFLCIDSRNKKKLCKDFGIKERELVLDSYWDIIVDKITSCVWWSDEPLTFENEIEQRIWNGRAAFLDVLYYQRPE